MALRGLHVLTLAGFAIAQPLYDLLATNADFFVARQANAGEITAFVATVSLLIPASLFALEAAAGLLGRRVGDTLHAVLLVVLVALIALPLLREVIPPAWGLLGAALLIAAGFTASYFYFQPARQFVTLLSPAIVIFPLVFLFASPIKGLILPVAPGHTETPAARDDDKPLPPIVMVLLDELPTTSLQNGNGGIDAEHLPHVAALAGDAHWFRNTTTVSDNTLTAVPAMLTGNLPNPDLTASVVDHPQNLFTLLEGRYGYNVVESVTELCPRTLCPPRDTGGWLARYQALMLDVSAVYLHLVVPERYRDRLPDISAQWQNFRWKEARELNNEALHQRALDEVKADRAEKFARFVASIEHTDQPTLHYLHILLPHTPYIRLPSGKLYSLPRRQDGLTGGRWQDNEVLVQESYRRHLLQLGFVDRLLGGLIDRLKAQDLYAPALIVLAADHGVSFQPGIAQRALTPDNYADIASVPLFIKRPGQRHGDISDRPAQTIDMLPSILDLLDITPPRRTDGRSLFAPAPSTAPERNVYFEHAQRVLEIDEAELEGQRRAALRRKQALMHGAEHGFYGFGDASAPGRPLTDYAMLEPRPLHVELDQAFLFNNVDPAGDFVPGYISGRLHNPGPADATDRIGIAVNGVLWAVVPPRTRTESMLRFSAVVPDQAFRPGTNDVQVLLVRDEVNGEPALIPAEAGTASRYRLVEAADGGYQLVAPDATTFPVVDDAVDGWLDEVDRRGELLQLGGWAADVDAGEPARHVVLFRNGEFLYAARPDFERTDVLQFFNNQGLRETGFKITLPAELIDEGDVLRVFAISRKGQASELQYFEAFKWREEP